MVGRKFFSFTVVCLLLVTTCSSFLTVTSGRSDQYPMWAADHRHTGYVNTSIGGDAPKVIWDVEPVGSSITEGYWMMNTAPILSPDGTLFLTHRLGKISAISADGAVLWAKTIPEMPEGTPALGPDGSLYVIGNIKGNVLLGSDVSGKSALYSFSENGTENWRLVLMGAATASTSLTVGPDGTVYASLIQIDQYETNKVINSTLVSVSKDGSLLWIRNLPPASNQRSPVVSVDGSVYLPTSSCLYSFNKNGTLRWQYGFPSDQQKYISESLVTESGDVEMIRDGVLYRLNENGMEEWNTTLSSKQDFLSFLLLDDDSGLSYAAIGNWLFAISEDGAILWQISTDIIESISYQPLLFSNDMIVVFMSERLACFDISPEGGGAQVWKTDRILPGTTSGPSGMAAGPDGTIYLVKEGTSSLHLLALGTATGSDNTTILVLTGAGALIIVMVVIAVWARKR